MKFGFLALCLIALLFVPSFATSQSLYLGLQVRPSVGVIFLEVVRYSDAALTQVADTRILFLATGWAAKSTLNLSWFVTNAHVVRPKQPFNKLKQWWFPTGRYIVKTADGQKYTALRVISDESTDLAALQIRVSVPALPIQSDQGVLPGHRILIVGYPLSFKSVMTEGRHPKTRPNLPHRASLSM